MMSEGDELSHALAELPPTEVAAVVLPPAVEFIVELSHVVEAHVLSAALLATLGVTAPVFLLFAARGGVTIAT